MRYPSFPDRKKSRQQVQTLVASLQKNARTPLLVSIDQEGVGYLMKHAIAEGKKTSPDIHTGICGEHGGEPQSVEFCHRIGLDYVSCSPFRVPIARLAAAQAALR